MGCTNESENENEESTDLNRTDWRLIGSKEVGKKMIGLE